MPQKNSKKVSSSLPRLPIIVHRNSTNNNQTIQRQIRTNSIVDLHTAMSRLPPDNLHSKYNLHINQPHIRSSVFLRKLHAQKNTPKINNISSNGVFQSSKQVNIKTPRRPSSSKINKGTGQSLRSKVSTRPLSSNGIRNNRLNTFTSPLYRPLSQSQLGKTNITLEKVSINNPVIPSKYSHHNIFGTAPKKIPQPPSSPSAPSPYVRRRGIVRIKNNT
jgi:hypothetical protein